MKTIFLIQNHKENKFLFVDYFDWSDKDFTLISAYRVPVNSPPFEPSNNINQASEYARRCGTKVITSDYGVKS